MSIRIGVSNYGIFEQLVARARQELPGDVELIAFGDVFDEVKESVRRMEAKGAVDIFVASGANARYMREYLKDTPLWEIQVTGYDILEALLSVRDYSAHAALVTYQASFPAFTHVKSVLNMDVREVVYHDRISELDQILESLAAEGIEDIIGSTYVVEKARQHNLRGHYVWSYDGFKKALESAIAIVRSRKTLEEQARKINYLLDYSAEGIIITDRDGVITDFNNSAERILKRSKKSMIGKNCRDVLPNTQLHTVIAERTPQYNKIQNVGSVRIVTNRSPIISNNEVVGALATFFSVSTYNAAVPTILKAESRQNLLAAGTFEDIHTVSERYHAVVERAQLYARLRSPLLIEGQAGTGKNLFAESIHNAGYRRMEPFWVVSGATLFQPDTLKAEGRKPGESGDNLELLPFAHNGTFFLDHLELLPPDAQGRLLQALSLYEGVENAALARVVVSTNIPLRQLLDTGRISESLYYRLNVLTLSLPKLKDHPEDISLLAHEQLMRLRPELSTQEGAAICALPLLTAYTWPGNVRELFNVMARFAALYHSGDVAEQILRECIPSDYVTDESSQAVSKQQKDPSKVLKDALRAAQGNQSKAAQLLGISRSTLWRKLQLAGIDPDDYRIK